MLELAYRRAAEVLRLHIQNLPNDGRSGVTAMPDEENEASHSPLLWAASSWRDLKALPRPVRRLFGYALWQAQLGGRHEDAKILQGFGGGGVLEVVEGFRGSTYRAVYTVRFAGAVIVIHVFQKQSKKGIKTPRREIELIRERLKLAREIYEDWCNAQADEKRPGI
jgi:phage-related protein